MISSYREELGIINENSGSKTQKKDEVGVVNVKEGKIQAQRGGEIKI